jgi:hypothetical protein
MGQRLYGGFIPTRAKAAYQTRDALVSPPGIRSEMTVQALRRRKKYRSHLVELRSFFEITSSSMYALNDLRMLNNLRPIVTSKLEIKRANAHSDGRI